MLLSFILPKATTLSSKVQPILWMWLHSASQNDIQILFIIITIFQMAKWNFWEVTWLAQGHSLDLKLKPCYGIQSFHISFSFVEQVQRQSQNLSEVNPVKFIRTAISYFHSLFLFICLKKCRTATVTKISGLQKLEKAITSTDIQNYQYIETRKAE